MVAWTRRLPPPVTGNGPDPGSADPPNSPPPSSRELSPMQRALAGLDGPDGPPPGVTVGIDSSVERPVVPAGPPGSSSATTGLSDGMAQSMTSSVAPPWAKAGPNSIEPGSALDYLGAPNVKDFDKPDATIKLPSGTVVQNRTVDVDGIPTTTMTQTLPGEASSVLSITKHMQGSLPGTGWGASYDLTMDSQGKPTGIEIHGGKSARSIRYDDKGVPTVEFEGANGSTFTWTPTVADFQAGGSGGGTGTVYDITRALMKDSQDLPDSWQPWTRDYSLGPLGGFSRLGPAVALFAAAPSISADLKQGMPASEAYTSELGGALVGYAAGSAAGGAAAEWSTALVGAEIGGAAGSAAPVVGTAVGIAAGAVVGAVAGYLATKSIQKGMEAAASPSKQDRYNLILPDDPAYLGSFLAQSNAQHPDWAKGKNIPSADSSHPDASRKAYDDWKSQRDGITSKLSGAKPGKHADGGSVSGPGSSIGDKIPAWLSDGEFVMNARSTSVNRPFLQALNSDPFFLQKVLAERLRPPVIGTPSQPASAAQPAVVNISASDSGDVVGRLKVLSMQWELMHSR